MFSTRIACSYPSILAANATYIVSDDSHFDVLRDITFPQLLVLRLKEFVEALKKEDML